jgi:hypothetical protein
MGVEWENNGIRKLFLLKAQVIVWMEWSFCYIFYYEFCALIYKVVSNW